MLTPDREEHLQEMQDAFKELSRKKYEAVKPLPAAYASGEQPYTKLPVLVSPLGKPVQAQSGRHSTRAEKQISVEQLQLYLSNHNSPLALYAAQLAASPYYSTIIGI